MVLAALVTALGAVTVALVQKNRSENRSDHAMVVTSLQRIESKIDTHIQDHARGRFDHDDEVVVVVPEQTMTATKSPRSVARKSQARKAS